MADFNTEKKRRTPKLSFASTRKTKRNKEAETEPQKPEAPVRAKPAMKNEPVPFEKTAEYTNLKVRLHQAVIRSINLSALDKMESDEIRMEIGEVVRTILDEEQVPMAAEERRGLISDIVDEIMGYGPIEPLLKDPTVNDILVNTYQQTFVERNGVLMETDVKFKDEEHLLRIIEKIVIQCGRRVDESQPNVDARLPDGSRVNAVIPPISVDGALLSIRKFAIIPYTVERLIEIGSMTAYGASLMEGIVRSRLNVLISGGTGTGKTTMLNALSNFIGDNERIVTIEDAAELQLQQVHLARMETRPKNTEGRGEVTQRELVRNALRMRPDRIIVGEVRAGEAFDMLQAMNTGHDGSLTTVHANTPRDALMRIEQMIGMSGLDLPMRSMRQQIASAIDIVIQIKRFGDGSRKLISIQEITGMEGDVITMQEIYRFEQEGVAADGTILGRYGPTGLRPLFFERFELNGIAIPENLLEGIAL